MARLSPLDFSMRLPEELSEEEQLRSSLAYNEISMGADGQVLTQMKKRTQRERKGYCLECRGAPTLLYSIKRSRMNPLFTSKKARSVTGECAGGICFICHPEKDPNRKKSGFRTTLGGINRRSIPKFSSSLLMNLKLSPKHRRPKVASPHTVARRISDPLGSSSREPTNHLAGPDGPHPNNFRQSIPAVFSPADSSSSRPRRLPSKLSPIPDLANMESPLADYDDDCEARTTLNKDAVLSRVPDRHEPIDPNIVRPFQSEPVMPPISQGEISDISSSMQEPNDDSESNYDPISGRCSLSNHQESVEEEEEESSNEEDENAIISGLNSLLSELITVPGAEEIVAQSLIGAMQENESSEAVLIYCLRTIWETCKQNDQLKREIMRLKAPENIVGSMTKFFKSSAMQEVGCGATWVLSIQPENRHAFIERGQSSVIIGAMKRFMDRESVVCAAVSALRALSPEDEARELMRIASGSKMVALAMNSHPTSSIIQRDGCAFLSNSAVDMKQQYVHVVPRSEMETVLQSMKNHRNEPAVMDMACFALNNYAKDENNCRTLRQIEMSSSLIQEAAAFLASPKCMEDAQDILEAIQLAQTLDNSIEDENYASFSSTVEHQINTSGFVNQILEFMEDNDWSPKLTKLGLEACGRLALGDSKHKDRIYNNKNLFQLFEFASNLAKEESVCSEACDLLCILGTDESKRPLLTSAGGCKILFHALAFKRNEALIRSCLQALELLASCNAGDCLDLIRPRKHHIREALEANPTSDSIMMSAISILSLVE